eukprot:7097579-Ditylum_brightwellii.AAC.1
MAYLASLKELCMKYKPTFKHSDLETIKLKQEYVNGSNKTKTCPMFTGEEGIEGLLFVEEQFQKIAHELGYNTGAEIFDSFKDVLADNAEMKWDNLVSAIPAADQTEL